MSVLIDEIMEKIKAEFSQKEPAWEHKPISVDDIIFLKGECEKESEFDPHNKRKHMLRNLANQKAIVMNVSCKYGQVFAAFEEGLTAKDVPWGLWGRILRMYSEAGSTPFKIFLLANDHLREFPPNTETITPHNINGGYTYRCNRETIVIYRAEDATRVLLHELMHSCCADKPENGIDIMEAETEAWAELMYIGVISQGKKYIFNDLLKRQSEWMRKQNEEVRKHMKNPESQEFPWRYTIGKQEVWERWDILSHEDLKPYIQIKGSLRLTYPPSNIIKDRFKVRNKSTIL
jgi:hypothetical protein